MIMLKLEKRNVRKFEKDQQVFFYDKGMNLLFVFGKF